MIADWDHPRRGTRADAWRITFHGALKKAGSSIRAFSESIERDKFRQQMKLGAEGSPFVADLGPLVRVAGIQAVLGQFVRDSGHDLVELGAPASSGADILGATGAVIHEAGQVATQTARALTGGITPSEAAEVCREIHEAQLALTALKVSVLSAVIKNPNIRAVSR